MRASCISLFFCSLFLRENAFTAALACATFARFYLVSWLGERVAADLRRDTFDRVISLSATFFETARVGDILTRLTADISVLQALIGSAISQWLRNAILLIGALGAISFGGIGLLTASRAQKIESVSGLINLVMMPMWIFSGVFFSYERFPKIFLPAIRALPLTALNDALRAIILQGIAAIAYGVDPEPVVTWLKE